MFCIPKATSPPLDRNDDKRRFGSKKEGRFTGSLSLPTASLDTPRGFILKPPNFSPWAHNCYCQKAVIITAAAAVIATAEISSGK